ncbi:DUF1294 domain-containing protein [Vulcaniibacterium tengchongense]|uniref:Uncharacterized membrane protein YsdA (DUF1294 family) n=1 Tax=Vulcaniibacterium tengchongense TaxID=1273429 RepID=A0A3N4VV91_9GAMM|nr:DUF1294 domain-containing protein [Vulcaniibacterium tengchongense]RPE80967.1 uncharacterized membrane protein YsdA (DUF1294 family) [Vulcaniibacterium tengchongense]
MLEAILAWLLVANVLAFAVYGYDKAMARRGAARVPENSLLGLAAVGGSAGAWLAMRAFRHKTEKRGFRVAFWAIVAVQLAALGAWAAWWLGLFGR